MPFRYYRNADPPRLAEIWNESFPGRGAVEVCAPAVLDAAIFNKPYFDAHGMIIAEDDHQRVVGFAHGGFGPSEDQTEIDRTVGVVSMVVVRPSHRGQGIGRELLRRCEDYLVGSGARTIQAGTQWPNAPFYVGIYGGSNAPGFLATDALAEPFLTRNGYGPMRRVGVYSRDLENLLNIADTRFVGFRRRYETRIIHEARLSSWWRECVFGPYEPAEFRLEERAGGVTVARAYYWEMKEYGWRWGAPVAGIIDVNVRSEFRGMGLGRYLLALLVKHLQDQHFGYAQAQVNEGEEHARRIFQNLGFELIDHGVTYQKMDSGNVVG